MSTNKDLLLMTAARLYSIGVDVEGAREKLRQLVEQKVPYDSPEMRDALRDFQQLDTQWKELEKDYLELRAECLGE